MVDLFKNQKWTDLGLTYLEALHAVQTGVKYEIAISDFPSRDDTTPHSPKHLRTGVNMAMVEISALVWLLIEKGIITESEYLEALRLATNQEVATYEARNPKFKFR